MAFLCDENERAARRLNRDSLNPGVRPAPTGMEFLEKMLAHLNRLRGPAAVRGERASERVHQLVKRLSQKHRAKVAQFLHLFPLSTPGCFQSVCSK